MSVHSGRGVAFGLGLALAIPVSSLIVAVLLVNRLVPFDGVRPLLDVIGLLTWASLGLFGPVGIGIAAWSAGVRRALTLVGIALLVMPAYLVLWFVGATSVSGALGNPF